MKKENAKSAIIAAIIVGAALLAGIWIIVNYPGGVIK